MTSDYAGSVAYIQKRDKKSEKRCDLRRQQKTERAWAALTCDGRRAAATGINQSIIYLLITHQAMKRSVAE